ncbi:MAG TPA: glutamine cyclotransferase [Paracoccus sp. (in: a-proteobacteria)]|uniref:Vgb family protein n=1 Tax=Paracoccus sp. TaxID=267 RepID=UPI002C69E250|nr:glutamine cyclotransferase [Paracoccus sp. (in: a-proteobacteria)]HWL55831.1 glutamine cyclotransferase [Paracoccus sp. (in: a-proteobacteria)]
MKHQAEILREYGPFPEADAIHGVSFDGRSVWVATGDHLLAIDPETGAAGQMLDVLADAGTAFDGRHLYQIAQSLIRKIDPADGRVVATIPAPGGGQASGLAWSEGSLWVGQYDGRTIVQIDAETGEVQREIRSDRFVTGVSWVEGELWHGTWENEQSELRQIDPLTGVVLESLKMPEGKIISGLESDGAERFFCGGGNSGKLRVLRRPRMAR